MPAAPSDLVKSLFIASDYEFLPEGVQAFKKNFDKRMNEENIVSPPSFEAFLSVAGLWRS